MAEAKLIDGKAFAAGLRTRVAKGVAELATSGGAKPGLATVLVGADPASEVYVRSKGKTASELGMASFDHRLPAETTEAELLTLIARLNADRSVNGILVQLPLPKHIDTPKILLAIDPNKDVDGFHPINVGRLGSIAAGAPLDFPVPCTPLGCSMLLADALAGLTDVKGFGHSGRLLNHADAAMRDHATRTEALERRESLLTDWMQAASLAATVGITLAGYQHLLAAPEDMSSVARRLVPLRLAPATGERITAAPAKKSSAGRRPRAGIDNSAEAPPLRRSRTGSCDGRRAARPCPRCSRRSPPMRTATCATARSCC